MCSENALINRYPLRCATKRLPTKGTSRHILGYTPEKSLTNVHDAIRLSPTRGTYSDISLLIQVSSLTSFSKIIKNWCLICIMIRDYVRLDHTSWLITKSYVHCTLLGASKSILHVLIPTKWKFQNLIATDHGSTEIESEVWSFVIYSEYFLWLQWKNIFLRWRGCSITFVTTIL